MFTVQDDPLFFRVELDGLVDQKVLFDAQDALMHHPEYPHKNALWIVKEDFICGFSEVDLIVALERIKTLWHQEATKKKSAFFAPDGFRYALAKLFCEEVERRGVPFKIKPFMNLQEAEAWLLKDGAE